MVESCPACGEPLDNQVYQRFCTECREPLNVEVDRAFIRRHAEGFLSLPKREMLLDAIHGRRDHRSEYTIAQVQEHARRGLLDFTFVYNWDALPNGDVFFAGLDEVAEGEGDGPDDGLNQTMAMMKVLAIFYATLGEDVLTELLEIAIWSEEDLDKDAVEVSISVNA